MEKCVNNIQIKSIIKIDDTAINKYFFIFLNSIILLFVNGFFKLSLAKNLRINSQTRIKQIYNISRDIILVQ